MTELKYFTLDEFDCSYTGENEMDEGFLEALDELRESCGFPFVITSGYRSPEHPKEASKTVPGKHSEGVAADIRVRGGWQRWMIVQAAIELGFNGIGVAKTFVHVDFRDDPVMWVYD